MMGLLSSSSLKMSKKSLDQRPAFFITLEFTAHHFKGFAQAYVIKHAAL